MNRQSILQRRVVLSALQYQRSAVTARRFAPIAAAVFTNSSLQHRAPLRQFHATPLTRISNDMLLSVSMNVPQKVATSQQEMVEQLRENQSLRTPRVFQAMSQVDRAFYARVPSKVATAAGAAAAAATNPYAHAPTAIGQCSTISSPYSHAIALETLEATGLLNPAKQPRVLDVGSGSGYLTACLAHLIHDPAAKEHSAQVVALEHSSVLLDQSKQNIAEDPRSAPLLQVESLLEFVQGDANDEEVKWNANEEELFDVIHVGAAFPKIPVHLVKLLREGGVLLSPVCLSSHNTKGEQELLLITKDEKVQVGFTTKKVMSCSYAPIAKEAPAVDVDEVSSVVRDLKALEEQIQAKKDALQQWQNEFKDKNGRKPSVTEMKADAVMSKLMNEVSPLLNKKKAMERIIAQANAQ